MARKGARLPAFQSGFCVYGVPWRLEVILMLSNRLDRIAWW
jgi:hypothetical protein